MPPITAILPVAKKIAFFVVPIVAEMVIRETWSRHMSKGASSASSNAEGRTSRHGRSGGTIDIGENGRYKKGGHHKPN
jgi:hypothetical protein